MTVYLRKSTASQEILIGMLLDDDDGVTPKTGLTIANTDIKIWKHGGTTVVDKNSGGATEISGGYYYATLDDTDTGTLGNLIIHVKVTDALMWRQECIVVSENFFDSMFSTDILDVSVTQWAGTALHARTTEGVPVCDVHTIPTDTIDAASVKADAVTKIQTGLATPTNITAGTITTVTNLTNAPTNGDLTATMKSSVTAAVPTAAANADAVWDEASTGHTDAGKAGAQMWTDIDAILEDTGTTLDDFLDTEIAAIVSELAKVPKSDSNVTWNATALASINAEVDTALNTVIPASNTANSINDILLDVTTKAAIVDAVWDEVLHTDHEVASSASVLLQAATAPTAAAVADAVWDEVLHTDHEVASSASVLLQAAGGASDPLLNAVPGAYSAGTAGYIIGTNLNAPVGTIDTVVDALATELAKVPKSDSTVTWNATALASINAEVDTALNTAIPESPTSDSINERIKTLDADWNDGGRLDLILDAASAPTAAAVADAVWDELLVGHVISGSAGNALGTASTGGVDVGLVADAVWDEAMSGHVTTGTAGKVVADILADTNELQAEWVDGGRLDLILDSAAAATTTRSTVSQSTNSNLLYKGDVGARIIISTGNTALEATDTLSLKIVKPSGATAEWSLTSPMINRTTGVLTYATTATSELNEVGDYQIQVKRVTFDGKTTHSGIGNFEVLDNAY